jgi:hypothetical protein
MLSIWIGSNVQVPGECFIIQGVSCRRDGGYQIREGFRKRQVPSPAVFDLKMMITWTILDFTRPLIYLFIGLVIKYFCCG